MKTITWEFEGRCIECGSEELVIDVIDDGVTTVEITVCEECGERFIVALSTDDAFYY